MTITSDATPELPGEGSVTDIAPEQPEPAVDIADEGLHEAIDDTKVLHGSASFVLRKGVAGSGGHEGGKPFGPRDETACSGSWEHAASARHFAYWRV